MKSLPRSPALQRLPLMCPRGSQTFLSPIRQNIAGAVDLMILTSWNGTSSSASSVFTAIALRVTLAEAARLLALRAGAGVPAGRGAAAGGAGFP
jgi:hypothetical protein